MFSKERSESFNLFTWVLFRVLFSIFLFFGWTTFVLSLKVTVCHAQSPSDNIQRIAVLELRGDVGSLAQRQAWSDTIRAAALQALSQTEIRVIDRDQFLTLLNPQRQLSDCVGMCAAEIAREIGAEWSISGVLTQEQDTSLITLKLHTATGTLLAIEQRRDLTAEKASSLLTEMTQKLLNHSFHLTSPHTSSTSVADLQINTLNDFQNPNSESHHDQDNGLQLRIPIDTRWFMINIEDKSYCVSPLITQKHYQKCVSEGACEPAKVWGGCVTRPQEPVRCINIQQALHFSRWSGGWLPSEAEWEQWANLASAQRSKYSYLFEWVVPQQESRRAEATWRFQFAQLSKQALRSAKSLTARQLEINHDQSVLPYALKQSRRSPPAFEVTDLSFRVVYPTSNDQCPPP